LYTFFYCNISCTFLFLGSFYQWMYIQIYMYIYVYYIYSYKYISIYVHIINLINLLCRTFFNLIIWIVREKLNLNLTSFLKLKYSKCTNKHFVSNLNCHRTISHHFLYYSHLFQPVETSSNKSSTTRRRRS